MKLISVSPSFSRFFSIQSSAIRTPPYSAWLFVVLPKNFEFLNISLPSTSTVKAQAAGPGLPLEPPSV